MPNNNSEGKRYGTEEEEKGQVNAVTSKETLQNNRVSGLKSASMSNKAVAAAESTVQGQIRIANSSKEPTMLGQKANQIHELAPAAKPMLKG